MINYYEILQVPNFSNEDTIKSSYKTLMLKHHPDKGGDSTIFQSIKEAYDILKDSDSKKDYDNKLMYHIEILERAEEIILSKEDNSFTCTQCQSKNAIHLSSLDISKDNICKCENCSMIFRINIK